MTRKKKRRDFRKAKWLTQFGESALTELGREYREKIGLHRTAVYKIFPDCSIARFAI